MGGSRCLSSLLTPLGNQLALAPAPSQAQHQRAVFAMYRDAAIAREAAGIKSSRAGLPHQAIRAISWLTPPTVMSVFDLCQFAGGMPAIDIAGIALPTGAIPHLDQPLSGPFALHRHEAKTVDP